MQDNNIFIALDFPDAESVNSFLKPFNLVEKKPALKVGMELFYSEGPYFVKQLRDAGYNIFLDLKLYDIPNTVAKAVSSINKLDVQYLTLHASGGKRMLEAAVQNKSKQLKLLAVTQLTSFSEQEMQTTQLTQVSMNDSVKHLAKIAYQAGVNGTISSANEAAMIKMVTEESFLRITPGIRLLGDDVSDQRRVMTPRKARENDSSGLVVGRSITQAVDPLQAYQRVLREWQEGDVQ